MKTMLYIIGIFIFSFTGIIAQQPADEDKVKFEIGGFVKTDIFYDTREVASLREGHFLLYPLNERFDVDGNDLHKKSTFNILSIQTRITGRLSGPKVLGAKTSGLVEGAFFGNTDADINGFRLRHAFVKLDWENTSILVGQFWHPFLIPDVFPEVISFNTGAPFQPFSRNPQIRFTQRFGGFEIIAAASSQRDISSPGPESPTSNRTVSNSSFLRNAALPMFDLQLRYASKPFTAGIGGGFKKLRPRLETENNIKTDETINSISAMAYTKITTDDFSIRAQGVYGQNLYDLLMIGGYAVSKKDPVTAKEEYTNIKTLSAWMDISYGSNFKVALFVGYAKNLGADDDIAGPVFSRGADIDKLIRISPRIVYLINKVQFAAEVENTIAYYGTPDIKGVVKDSKSVFNTRILLATYYFF